VPQTSETNAETTHVDYRLNHCTETSQSNKNTLPGNAAATVSSVAVNGKPVKRKTGFDSVEGGASLARPCSIPITHAVLTCSIDIPQVHLLLNNYLTSTLSPVTLLN